MTLREVAADEAADGAALVHLRARAVSVLVDAAGPGLPRVMHWGADLGEADDDLLASVARAGVPPVPHAGLDAPAPVSIVPAEADGFPGTPGLAGHRDDGSAWSPSFRLDRVERPGPGCLTVHGVDAAAKLSLQSTFELSRAGVLRVRHAVRNDGDGRFVVDGLAATLPVPSRAAELLDLTGRWCRERAPQRHPFHFGTWRREGRRGRTGHDATLLLVAGTPGFGFRSGEVWGVHVAWSGDHVTYAERVPEGTAVLGGGELLLPGEVMLEPGAEYATPWLYAAWSDRGLDGMSAALHAWIRARARHPGPDRPRPVVLNTWEAVYFDHDLDRLRGLADTAAGLGVERFVLDDGWFRHRRDDTVGLGDWYVSEDVWPQGLHPLVDHVRKLGMEFGLWVEPEMVNPDSDLARDHPEWVLGVDGRTPPPARHQQVVNLADPGAYEYVLGRLDALLREYDIDYLKWDHNRDLIDAGNAGRAGVRAQTLAAYQLLDELRRRHPYVEIESCSSGGARVDLEILERTDRVWASDCNDALERQAIQRWTGLLLPPELIGTHVGPPRAHTTGRVHDLSFRAVTALFGHAGIEWDVTSASPEERADLARWIDFYKETRPLLHSGEIVRVDSPDPAVWVHGVVSPDRAEALFAVVALAPTAAAIPDSVRLPALDPDRRYRVQPVYPAGRPRSIERIEPAWLRGGEVWLTGRALAATGIRTPILAPEQALLLHVGAR